MMQPIPDSDGAIRALAAEILQRRDYTRWRSDPAVWLHRLQRWFSTLQRWIDRLASGSPVLYWLMLGGLLLVSALLLAHLTWSVRVAMRRDPAPAPSPEEGGAPPPFASEAESLAGSGRFLEAAHRMQLAVLDLLLRRGIVELRRSEPNRVLRRRILQARLPAAERQVLLSLLDRFERRWFRDRVDDQDLYESWRSLHARLLYGERA